MRLPLVDRYVQLIRRNPDFRYLWFSQVISLLGDWFTLIASAGLVANLSGSGLAIGSLFVARLLPPFIFGAIAGVVADRYNRRTILIVSDLLRAMVVLNFLFVHSEETIWLLYTLTVIQLSISAFFEPTRAAVLPSLVNREDLITANALSGATWSIMLAMGAALGGLVTALFGLDAAFITDAATYLLSAWLITRINFNRKGSAAVAAVDDSGGANWTAFVDGLRYLGQRPPLLGIALVKASSALAFGAIEVVQVMYAEAYFPLFGDGSATLGIIYFVVGLGTGLGPIIAQRVTKENLGAMYIALLVAYGLIIAGSLLLGWGPILSVVLLGTFVRTLGTGINWVYSSTILQMAVPDNYLGRVFAFDLAMTTLAASTSTLWAGWAADTLGFSPQHISLSMAGVATGMAAGWLLYLLRYGRNPEALRG